MASINTGEAIGLDIMPRSLALTLVAGTLLGGSFWTIVAALLVR